MIDTVEIRKAKNGFVVMINSEDSSEEYVFDNMRKVFRFLKERLDPKDAS